MNKVARINISPRVIGLLLLFLFAEILVGLATVFLPYYWITLLLGVVVFILVVSYPMVGISLMMISLYFPLLPSVPLGPLQFSGSTLPAIGLALGTFFRSRFRGDRVYLAGWQKLLFTMLVLIYLLSSLFSTDYLSTAKFVPNMLIYLIILFGLMAEINTIEKIQYIGKLIVVITFVLSIWRIELRPLRGLLGLPSFGVNGAVFAFHSGVALTLVLLLLMSKDAFTIRWRWFTGITLASLLVHGVQYETRAAWLAWLVIIVVLFTRVYWVRWLRFLPLFLIVGAISVFIYGARIDFNYKETASTVEAALFGGNYATVSSDDRVRLYARDAGWRMFQLRPVLGWGPNRFNFLKPNFVYDTSKESNEEGTFNSWLTMLVETGLIGLLVGLLISLAGLGISWYLLHKNKKVIHYWAFGFGLSVLGLAVHLAFIDLMYSFYWMHVGFALAAARVALENRDVELEHV